MTNPSSDALTPGSDSSAIEDVGFEDEAPLLLPLERFDLRCPECAGGWLRLRPSEHGFFYGCTGWPECKGSHGARPDGAPMGIPADKATKKYRIAAHRTFDMLWKSKPARMTRNQAYAWMRKGMKLTEEAAHISMFDAAQCQALIALVKQRFPEFKTGWDRLLDDDSF